MSNTEFDYRGFLFFVSFLAVGFISFAVWRDVSVRAAALFYEDKYALDSSSVPVAPIVSADTAPVDANRDTIPEASPLHLGFVGDIMLDRGVRGKIMRHGGDYFFPFEQIATTTRAFDILFGNLEGPISDRGVNVGSIYSFRMATSAAVALAQAGFDVLSVANNHAGDWGKDAMRDTYDWLTTVGIKPVGGGATSDKAYAPIFFEVKGVRVAYVAFSQFGAGYLEAGTSTPGITVITEEAVQTGVESARANADIVVASFHFGEEYQSSPSEYQKRIAHLAVDSGADIVVGHHPHVFEPIEYYHGATIVYSLGNFIFDQPFSTSTMASSILSLTFENGTTTKVEILQAIMNSDYQPVLNVPVEVEGE